MIRGCACVPGRAACVPGRAAAWRGFDLLPVCVADTARLLATLRRHGFDAGTRGNLVGFGRRERGRPGKRSRTAGEHGVHTVLRDRAGS